MRKYRTQLGKTFHASNEREMPYAKQQAEAWLGKRRGWITPLRNAVEFEEEYYTERDKRGDEKQLVRKIATKFESIGYHVTLEEA